MVLLHGLSESAEVVSDLVVGVAAGGVRVVAVDLRGHGRSGRADRYRHNDYAADVARVIEQVSTGPVVVFGHSLGGVVAVSLAQSRPELVAGLVLGDPPLFEGDPGVRAASASARAHSDMVARIRQWQASGISGSRLAAELGRRPSPHHGQRLNDMLTASSLAAWSTALLAFDPAAMDASITGELWAGFDPDQPLQCSTLVIRADPGLGAVFTPEHARRLLAATPTASTALVPGVSHWLYLEASGLTATVQEILSFTASLGPRSHG